MRLRTKVWLLAVAISLVTWPVSACLFGSLGGFFGDALILRNLR